MKRSWWWIVRKYESGLSVDPADAPYCEASRWRWTLLYWNDGSRSAFCNVWAPWKWLAKFIALRILNHKAYCGKESR